MKTTQLLFATFTTAILIFLWSFTFWGIVSPIEMAYKSITSQAQLDSLVQSVSTGQYSLKSVTYPELTGHLIIAPVTDVMNIVLLVKNALVSIAISLLACLIMVIGNLHRGSFLQRFVVILGIGILQMFQYLQPEIISPQNSWKLILINATYNFVFWLILATTMSIQMGVKKRNIFRE